MSKRKESYEAKQYLLTIGDNEEEESPHFLNSLSCRFNNLSKKVISNCQKKTDRSLDQSSFSKNKKKAQSIYKNSIFKGNGKTDLSIQTNLYTKKEINWYEMNCRTRYDKRMMEISRSVGKSGISIPKITIGKLSQFCTAKKLLKPVKNPQNRIKLVIRSCTDHAKQACRLKTTM